MTRSRPSIILTLPLITLLCLILSILAVVPLGIPRYAESIYGPSAETISLKEKIYLSTMLIFQQKDLTTNRLQPMDEINFVVELGESPISVVERLADLKLINNPNALRNYMVYAGIDTKIKAGDYTLNTNLSPIEIAHIIQDPTPRQLEFSILAGWRAEEIAESLQYSGLSITPENFMAMVNRNDAEGYLFPGTYTFNRNTSAVILIQTLVNKFNATVTSDMKAGFESNGLSLDDAVVLASIVEREAIDEAEMPLIASVFINRLKIGMKLDADPTVQYAVGYNPSQATWWTNPLGWDDLDTESPFNTYLNPGLPPGPISNPGLNALRAVAFPAQTQYYYFRAACDNSGRHLFSETFEEHEANFCP